MIVAHLFAVGARISGTQLKWEATGSTAERQSAAFGEESRSPQGGRE